MAELEQVVKARPVAEFYFHLGQARADLGQKDTAMLAYREALKIDPAYAPALDAVKAMTTPAPAPAPAPAAAPRKN